MCCVHLPRASAQQGMLLLDLFVVTSGELCIIPEQDEKGIVRLNIDFLICIKSIVLWPNLRKMTTNFDSAQLFRNRWAEWCIIFRYDKRI
jgi:hypothetical protein